MIPRSFHRLQRYLFGGWEGEPVKVILIGLDAAGKTTFLYKAHSHIVTTIPTIGFNVETARISNAEITCWDIGGCDKIRPLWRHYTRDSVAAVMFVDSNDRDRMCDAKHELEIFLQDETMVGVSLLVVANKQDLPRAATVQEVVDYLGLNEVRDHDWSIIATSVAYGRGVSEIVNWVKNAANEGRSKGAQKSAGSVLTSTSPAASEAAAPSFDSPTTGHLIHTKPSSEYPSSSSNSASSMLDTVPVPAPPPPPSTEDVRQSWLARAHTDIPEDKFLSLLGSYQLDIWDHYTHVRIAWVLIKNHGVEGGFNRVESAIRTFIERSPRTDARSFHATMTRFWCHMIAYAMAWMYRLLDPDYLCQAVFGDFIDALCAEGSRLGDAVPLWDKTLFKQYYNSPAMFRSEARVSPNPPDQQSLPDIVPKLKSDEPTELQLRDVAFLNSTVYWKLAV